MVNVTAYAVESLNYFKDFDQDHVAAITVYL